MAVSVLINPGVHLLMPEAGPGVGFPHPSSAPKTLVTWEVPARRAGGAPTDATRGSINTGERQNSVALLTRSFTCGRGRGYDTANNVHCDVPARERGGRGSGGRVEKISW